MAEAAPDVVITWSFENWLTILLMVAIGFAILAIGAQFARRALNKGAPASNA
jgi:hypothetical protein